MTTLPALAGVDDLRAWPGVVVTDEQESGAETVLAAVSARVRRIAGRTWITVDDQGEPVLGVVPDDVVAIVVEVTASFWGNPSGAIMRTKVRGPFTETEQYAQDIAAGIGPLVDAQRDAILDAVRTRRRRGFGTVATTRGDPSPRSWESDTWPRVPVVDSGGVPQRPLPEGYAP